MASFFTAVPPAPPARPGGQPGLKVLPSTSIPWACKVENELDPSHVLPCCHLVSLLFFRLKWPQNIGSSEIVRISNRVIYAGRDLTRSQESVVTSSSSLAWKGAPTFGGGYGVSFVLHLQWSPPRPCADYCRAASSAPCLPEPVNNYLPLPISGMRT